MDKVAVQPPAELADFLDKNPGTMIRLGVTDTDGVLRGRFVTREKLLSAVETGLSICDCLLGWDVDDTLYELPDRPGAVGWHFGFPDAPLRVAGDSLRLIEGGDGRAAVWALCEFDGKYEAVCARSLLRRVVARAEHLGYFATCGFEYEFTLFREDSRSLREKGFRNLRPLTDGNFGYSALKMTEYEELFCELKATTDRFGASVEGLHTENGPGIWEIALSPSDPLRAADNAALLKIAVKRFAMKRGLTACFMAKISEAHQGQGGHIHLSLRNSERQPCFPDPHPGRPSSTLLHFIGGQQRLMPEFTALAAPTINSYRRLVPGTWAPTVATWGIDNRTCALRVLLNSPDSARVEYRLAGADANPYLALAAALGSGLYGIENALEPGDPITGNAYDQPHDESLRIPADLNTAARLLDDSAASRSLFGDPFIDHFVMSRKWECAQFAKSVTDWELARYAEII